MNYIKQYIEDAKQILETILKSNSNAFREAVLVEYPRKGVWVIGFTTGEVKGDSLDIDGNSQLDGTLTVGVDDTGYDVKFFGATSGRYMLWDESADSLILLDNVQLQVGSDADIRMLHDGTDSKIRSTTSDLYITQEGVKF